MEDIPLSAYERLDLKHGLPLKKRAWINPKATGAVKNSSSMPKSACCPKCKKITKMIICPKCHNHIPKSTTEGRDIIISLAGARDSGKSLFMGVLIHHLRREVMSYFGGAKLCNDSP